MSYTFHTRKSFKDHNDNRQNIYFNNHYANIFYFVKRFYKNITDKGRDFRVTLQAIDLKQKKIDLQRQHFLGKITQLKTDSSKIQLPICRKLVLILAKWKLQSGFPKWVFPGESDKPLYPDT